ncbi:hypothetical protein [Streptomyces sp. NPDC049949]|uniref:hypothetical protein n=1 Tax=Streptomyces sp. NPDC049949 TaxID=3154627 RepID=UPI003424DE8A
MADPPSSESGEQLHSQVGVEVIQVEQARQILADAIAAGIPHFVFDTRGREDRESIFREIRNSIPLDPPLASSGSWDALSDSLFGGLYETSGEFVTVVWMNAGWREGVAGDLLTTFQIFEEVVALLQDERATAGKPKRVLVYITN